MNACLGPHLTPLYTTLCPLAAPHDAGAGSVAARPPATSFAPAQAVPGWAAGAQMLVTGRAGAIVGGVPQSPKNSWLKAAVRLRVMRQPGIGAPVPEKV
jgi:hypothetical protein